MLTVHPQVRQHCAIHHICLQKLHVVLVLCIRSFREESGTQAGGAKCQSWRLEAAAVQVLTYGVDAMRARFEFLHGLGLSRKEAAGVLARCPTVLSLSVQANLWPKVEYLTQELSGTARSLTTWPVYLTLSLQHRCVALQWGTQLRCPVASCLPRSCVALPRGHSMWCAEALPALMLSVMPAMVTLLLSSSSIACKSRPAARHLSCRVLHGRLPRCHR